ncbi:hypothetical protein Pelo_5466 [Pelomyxa schiedti]|nr:hypothetical protein Pelo_5466 [Pelomyxa schiedti]
MLSPIIIATIIAGGLAILGLIFVPGPDKHLHRLLAVTAVICLYLMWLSCYVSQMTPLAPPQPKLAEE